MTRFRLTKLAVASLAVTVLVLTVGVITPPPSEAQGASGQGSGGEGSTMDGGIINAVEWASRLSCKGPGCGSDLKFEVYEECGAPIIHLSGSFIVSSASWAEHEELINDELVLESTSDIGQDYVLIETARSSLGIMQELQKQGVEITMNAVTFHSQFWGWYPESEPSTAGTEAFAWDALDASNAPGRVVTIDTGITQGDNELLTHGVVGFASDNYDSSELDNATGHGPAIADLIGDMVGLPEDSKERVASQLRKLDYEHGATQSMMTHPDGSTVFDTASLLSSLQQVPTATDIVNLSLGLKSCPELSVVWQADPDTGKPVPVQIDPVRQWIIDNPTVTVVASAGNSASNLPTYPAGWTTDPDVPNLISVGSMGTDGTRSCFSDYGDWVDWYAVGENVLVQHPTMGEVVWSGTSFAAPQIAAALSSGADLNEVASPAAQVGEPSRLNQQFCAG